MGFSPFSDYLQLMTGADYVFYPEPCDLIPLASLPSHHLLIGPVLWSPAGSLPDCLTDIALGRPLIYVTLGSTGETSRLPELVSRLAQLDVAVVVSTAHRLVLENTEPNVVVAEMVPGQAMCARASLVIGSGGSGTAYQAIASGTPIVALWNNEDQYLTSMVLAARGAALAHGPEDSVDDVMRSVARMLKDSAFTESARELATTFAAVDARRAFPAAMDKILRRLPPRERVVDLG